MLANGQNLTNRPSTADGSTTLFREDQERFLQCSPPRTASPAYPLNQSHYRPTATLACTRRDQELLLKCSPPPRAADGRTSLLRRDQELLLQCSPPRTALHRPTLIQYTRDWRTATILGHPSDRDPPVEWMHPPACLAHGAPVELSWLLVPGAPPQASGCGREVHVIRPRRQSPPPRRTAAILGHLHRGREVHVIKPRRLSPPPQHSVAIFAASEKYT